MSNSSILIATYLSGDSKELCKEEIKELETLSNNCDIDVIDYIISPIKRYIASTFIGKGKLLQVKELIETYGASYVIFNDDITPAQQRNLERILKVSVLDRSEVILNLFLKRAKSGESLLQAEVAKIKYQIPRLKRLWLHLSSETSPGDSSGSSRGVGEKQIELDRRILKKRLFKLEKKLLAITENRGIKRKKRVRRGLFIFGIVGYTNSGKSTLLNAISGGDAKAEDNLFVTLDTKVKRCYLGRDIEALCIDTVGFIRKLPTMLSAAFRSTLEEVCYVDFLLHVVDATSSDVDNKVKTTLDVLEELGVSDKPLITLLNKVDLCERSILEMLKMKYPGSIEISAKEKKFGVMFEKMIELINNAKKVYELVVPYDKTHIANKIIEEYSTTVDYRDDGIVLRVESPFLEGAYLEFLKKSLS